MSGAAFSTSTWRRHVLTAGGIAATSAGLHTAAVGVRSVPGARRCEDPALDSELRYYGSFYAAYGLQLLDASRRGNGDLALLRPVFLGGLARALGWRAFGRPSPAQIALMAIELTAPPLMLAFDRRSRAPRP